jgi:hypothetical protein
MDLMDSLHHWHPTCSDYFQTTALPSRTLIVLRKASQGLARTKRLRGPRMTELGEEELNWCCIKGSRCEKRHNLAKNNTNVAIRRIRHGNFF